MLKWKAPTSFSLTRTAFRREEMSRVSRYLVALLPSWSVWPLKALLRSVVGDLCGFLDLGGDLVLI